VIKNISTLAQMTSVTHTPFRHLIQSQTQTNQCLH